MKIIQILSRRNNVNKQNYAQPIIYEWEDILAEKLNLRVTTINILQRLINRLGTPISIGPYVGTFRYVTNGRLFDEPMNNKHIIPCIIDFFEDENQLPEFYAKHSKNRLVLLSSPFDYDYLKKKNCPLNIGLFAYSLADKYATGYMDIEKKYDIVLTGRQDPVLYLFFKEYIKKHPNVTYVKRGQNIENDDKKNKSYYLNGKEWISDLNTREDFMRLQAQGRVTLYGTQGYDINNFFHMTPHFLEIIACGSHVLLHYPTDEMGVDSRYYEFNKFSPSVETYDEFERLMDRAIDTEVDKVMYADYLKKHLTSARVEGLKELLGKIEE